jgi:hypothetical protein
MVVSIRTITGAYDAEPLGFIVVIVVNLADPVEDLQSFAGLHVLLESSGHGFLLRPMVPGLYSLLNERVVESEIRGHLISSSEQSTHGDVWQQGPSGLC